MKKTTKFLLVLAAVVAMTIGAVSTVMAADVTIDASTWAADKNGVYSASDVDGNKIMRGWAVSNESGRWYYFVNGQMQTNRFITTANKTYYVGSDGAMVSGWFEFNKDIKVNVNGAGYNNVADAFGADSYLGSDLIYALTDKTQYKTVWCYFNEDGTLVKNAWKDVDGIWYYFDGPFCLMSEYSFAIKDSDGKTFKYGFDASGAVLSGWIAVPNTTKTAASGQGPNATPEKTSTAYTWAYYGAGCKQAEAGWLKDADGNWFYMVADEKAGYVALANTYFQDTDGNYYYFNDSCYMSTGETTIYGGSAKEGKNINVLTNTAAGIVTGTAMNVAKDKSLTLSFNETGALLKGVQGNMFYEDGDGVSTKYTIAVSVVDVKDENDKVIGKKIVVKAAEVDDSKTALGTKYNNSFILIDKDGKVRYFDNGVMVKLDTVVFGNQILAFDKDGVLVGATAVEISGVKYVASADQMTLVIKDADGNETESLVPGVYYSVVTK